MKKAKLFNYVDPNIVNEASTIVADAMAAFLKETFGEHNSDQLKAAAMAAIAAFFSTMIHGGHHDQAHRAAVSASKSISHAVDSANIAADKIQQPKEKLLTTLNIASQLIKRAAMLGIPEFPEHTREQIGNDVATVMNLFTCLPKKATTKGKGLFGGGIHDYVNNLNTEWLNPEDDVVGGGFMDWFSGLFSSGSNDTTTSSASDFSSDINTTNTTYSPYGFTPKPGYVPPPGMTPVPDSGTSDAYPLVALKDQPPGPMEFPQTPMQKIREIFGTKILENQNVGIETGGYDKPPGFFKSLLGLVPAAVNWATGNPYATLMTLNYAIPIVRNLWTPTTKLLGFIGDQTYGRLRRAVKSGNYDANLQQVDRELEALKRRNEVKRKKGELGDPVPFGTELRLNANTLGKIVKGIMEWNDNRITDFQKWADEPETKKAFSNLATTVSTLAPAAAQDYLLYKQRMMQYQREVDKARQEHAYQEARERQAITRENARIIAENKRERDEAMRYNSDVMAERADAIGYLDRLNKYDQTVREAKEKFIDQTLEYQKHVKDFERKKLTLAAEREANQKIWATGAALGKGILTTVALAVTGAPGGPLGIAAGITAGATYTISSTMQAYNDHAAAANLLYDEALQAENAHNAILAEQKRREARQEAEQARQSMKEGIKEYTKLQKEYKEVLDKQAKERMQKVEQVAENFVNAGTNAIDAAAALKNADLLRQEGTYIPPIDTSGTIPMPRPPVPHKTLKYVPPEIAADDPRLAQYIPKPFFEPIKPLDIYSMPYTKQALAELDAKLAANQPQPKQPEKKVDDPLPYVKALKKTKVDSTNGVSQTLRTTIQRQPSKIVLDPYGAVGNKYSYSKRSPATATSRFIPSAVLSFQSPSTFSSPSSLSSSLSSSSRTQPKAKRARRK